MYVFALDPWTPVSVDRALSVTRGGQIDLRPALTFHADSVSMNCNVRFVATDSCGLLRPSRFNCNNYFGPILYQHIGCLSDLELATFQISSPTETSENVSIFSVEVIIKPPQPPTSEITLELLEDDQSDADLKEQGAYSFRIVFPTELIGRCHYEIIAEWPHLSLPSSGTLIGVSNQPIPCGFMDASGLTYFPSNSSALVEDHVLIKVHSRYEHRQNKFLILPMNLRLPNDSSTDVVEVLPRQLLVVRQGANTPIPASLLTFCNSSHLLHLNNSQYLYRYTFPVLNAGSFRSILGSSINVTHTTFTSRELHGGTVAFCPNFSAPSQTVFQYSISDAAGLVVAIGEITVFVQEHMWAWPVQRTNRPLEVSEGGSSIIDQNTLDFYLLDLCSHQATMTVLVPPEHGHLTYLNGSDVGGTSLLIGAMKNGTVLVYNHSSSEELTDSIIWEVSCPGGPILHVFTSVLVAPRDDSPTILLGGWDIVIHRNWATPISPSMFIVFDLDSGLDEISVDVLNDTELVKFDLEKLSNINEASDFPPFINVGNLLDQNVTHKVSNFSLSELEDYSIWYVPPTNTSVINQYLTFSIGDSNTAVAVDIKNVDLNQSLYLTTQEEYPSVLRNLPLPLHTHTGTYITSFYLYSQATPHPPGKVVYMVHSPPTNGLLCLLSGEECHSSANRFTQRDINSQRVYYKPGKTNGIKEDTFEFELTMDEFHQYTTTLHQFHLKPVQTGVNIAMDRTFYVNAGERKRIAPRHFRPFSQFLDSRNIVFHVLHKPHYGHLELNDGVNPSNFTFQDLLDRELIYRHHPSATEACSDQFTFSVGNATHSLEGTMRVAIRRGQDNVHVILGRHTLLGQRKFVFGSEDINVSSSFCLEFVTFSLNSLPRMGVLSLVDNEHNTVVRLQENSTFSADDVNSGFLHYTYTDQVPVDNQISDTFNLTASDPTSKWPSLAVSRQGDTQTTGHFVVFIIPSSDVKHKLEIEITSPGFLTWLPSYQRYGYFFSQDNINMYNSTVQPHQVVFQLDREPEFGSIWKNDALDNIFTVEDINNEIVWYRSDVRLNGFSNDSFRIGIIIKLMGFSMLTDKRYDFVIDWATVQLQDNNLTISESAGHVEIVVR